MSSEAASGTAAALAEGEYPLKEMRMVMHRTMERVRADTPEDGGTALGLQVRSMVQARATTQAMLGALDGNSSGQSANGGQGGTQGGSGSGGGQGGGGSGGSGGSGGGGKGGH